LPPPGLPQQLAQIRKAQVDELVTVHPDRPGAAGGADRGELHRSPSAGSVSARYRPSAWKIGASLNRNRSSPPESEPGSGSAATVSGCQDGTTNRSPRVTRQV